jgi:hypothetical protein
LSRTAAVTLCLYSDKDIDSAPAFSISGLSSSSSFGTSPTTSQQISIYTPSPMHGVYCAAIGLIN